MAGIGESVTRHRGNVCNVKHVTLQDNTAYERPGVRRHRPDLTQRTDCGPVEIVMGHDVDYLPVEAIDDTVLGSAQLDGIVCDRLKHGLNVCR